jgi:hypothetical protein
MAPALAAGASEKPTATNPIASLPLPKQGDLLTQPVPSHPAKPTMPADEESEPASPLSHDEPDAHKSDSHG